MDARTAEELGTAAFRIVFILCILVFAKGCQDSVREENMKTLEISKIETKIDAIHKAVVGEMR